MLFFGTSGDSKYLHKLIDDAHFTTEKPDSREFSEDGLDVEYFTYKLTPQQLAIQALTLLSLATRNPVSAALRQGWMRRPAGARLSRPE